LGYVQQYTHSKNIGSNICKVEAVVALYRQITYLVGVKTAVPTRSVLRLTLLKEFLQRFDGEYTLV